MDELRKLLSILLLAVFGLPVVLPAFALGVDPEAGLAACCRRNGTHHCAMNAGLGATEQAARVGAPQHCSSWPRTVTATHFDPPAPGRLVKVFAAGDSARAGTVQLESKRRMRRDGARQMRGPPAQVPDFLA